MKTCWCGKPAYACFKHNPKFLYKLGDWVEYGEKPQLLCQKHLEALSNSKKRDYVYFLLTIEDRL